MIKRFYLFFFICLFLFSGCKSSLPTVKSEIKDISLGDLLYKNSLVSFNGVNLYLKKCDFSLDSDGKVQNASGSIFVQKDSCIIISVVALLGIEVARIRISPKEVVIIDRFHKQVITSDYLKFTGSFSSDLDFYTLQSLLFNQVFNLKNHSVLITKSDAFDVQIVNNNYSIRTHDTKRFLWLQYPQNSDFRQDFLIDPATFQLHSTLITRSSLDNHLTVNYSKFQDISGVSYPTSIVSEGSFNGRSFIFRIHSGLANINTSSSINFNIPSSYERVVK